MLRCFVVIGKMSQFRHTSAPKVPKKMQGGTQAIQVMPIFKLLAARGNFFIHLTISFEMLTLKQQELVF